jgi:hypothetical protein
MLTYSQISARAYDTMGSPQDSGVSLANIQQDINQAQQLFKHAVRGYWDRNQVTANLVSGQQDYTMPANFVRTTEVTITANGIVYPLVQVASEHQWNQLNVIPAVTIYIPTRFFIKGFNVISIWPAPSTTNVGALSVSFKPRTRDWYSSSLGDVTGTANITNGSVLVTDSATSFLPSMIGDGFTVTDGTGGNWYPVQSVPTNSTLNLQNNYIDQTNGTARYLIGQVPDIPEDYHMALVYFPLYQFELKRGNMKAAENYLALFQNLLDKYEETYAVKTTGIVQTKQRGAVYSVFGIPPTNITA